MMVVVVWLLIPSLVLLQGVVQPVWTCGPGKSYSSQRRASRERRPLILEQYVPSTPEDNFMASGLSEGRIRRNDSSFKELIINRNQNIIFSGIRGMFFKVEKYLSKRCSAKLDLLSVSVANQWPGVGLRVVRGWFDHLHDGYTSESLHYEGRAVDVVTSDMDKGKYGILARLAVEVGFDWVYYEKRTHIHCSVKSDKTVGAKDGMCFPGDAELTLDTGQTVQMKDLRIGQKVSTFDLNTGKIIFTEVIAFLHRDTDSYFDSHVTISTEDGSEISLSPDHLIRVYRRKKLTNEKIAADYTPNFISNWKDNLYKSLSGLGLGITYELLRNKINFKNQISPNKQVLGSNLNVDRSVLENNNSNNSNYTTRVRRNYFGKLSLINKIIFHIRDSLLGMGREKVHYKNKHPSINHHQRENNLIESILYHFVTSSNFFNYSAVENNSLYSFNLSLAPATSYIQSFFKTFAYSNFSNYNRGIETGYVEYNESIDCENYIRFRCMGNINCNMNLKSLLLKTIDTLTIAIRDDIIIIIKNIFLIIFNIISYTIKNVSVSCVDFIIKTIDIICHVFTLIIEILQFNYHPSNDESLNAEEYCYMLVGMNGGVSAKWNRYSSNPLGGMNYSKVGSSESKYACVYLNKFYDSLFIYAHQVTKGDLVRVMKGNDKLIFSDATERIQNNNNNLFSANKTLRERNNEFISFVSRVKSVHNESSKTFAREDNVYLRNASDKPISAIKSSATVSDELKSVPRGLYAPLTRTGTIIVDGIFVSCYAFVSSHTLAHAVMQPYVWYNDIIIAYTTNSTIDIDESLKSLKSGNRKILNYAYWLYELTKHILPTDFFNP